ncbi:TPA: hypothetical protein N3O60_004940 [Klebsiella variicola subsp. variicola]|nr:hypothetical protein [Klebsiella variicola subsp. variicola]HCM6632711.1 hypothetical protein [Klebsiella variicola subsp. variicola]
MQKVTLRTEIVGKKFISTHSLTHQDGKFYKHYPFKACLKRVACAVKYKKPRFRRGFFFILSAPSFQHFFCATVSEPVFNLRRRAFQAEGA